jgi:hypothetical protein
MFILISETQTVRRIFSTATLYTLIALPISIRLGKPSATFVLLSPDRFLFPRCLYNNNNIKRQKIPTNMGLEVLYLRKATDPKHIHVE